MHITALLPWFGGKRTMAPSIVAELGPHRYYFEACCGSMAVLFAMKPSSHEIVCDLHGGLMNLAWVVQVEDLAVQLFNRLQCVLYADEIYVASKDWLYRRAAQGDAQDDAQDEPDLDWAYHYFLASWMGRNGVEGTAQVNYTIATRWTQGGGSGPLRWRNAVASIPAWCERLRNVHVLRRDVFDVLGRLEDAPGLAIYCDPPYFAETRSGKTGSGKGYVHDFAGGEHVRLAESLRRFEKARVVVSYYADDRLRDLYQGWTVLDCSRQKHMRVQNARGIGKGMCSAPEVLVINGPAIDKALPLAKRSRSEVGLFE